MTWEEFIKYANNAAEAGGAIGHTVGAAVQGYKDGRAGDNTRYRNINDIQVTAGMDENTTETVKKTGMGLGLAVAAAAALFFLTKFKK